MSLLMDKGILVHWMEILDNLHSTGNTIILVTHEDDIAKHAKRTIRLFDGKIIEDEISK